MTAPRVVAQPLGGAPLTRAALGGSAPEKWYPPRPRTADDWQAQVTRLRADFAGRHWLDPLAGALPAAGAGAERLARVAARGGVVVVSGQQPGLFGGPLYTWYKALSVLALADELQAVTGVPVAPVFWAATDDADFEEGRATFVARAGAVERLELAAPEQPISSLRATPLGGVESLVAALERGVGAAVHPAVLQLVRSAYRDGATVGGAYVALLRSLLGQLGVAVLDAGHPAVRRAARPVLVEALDGASAIGRALAERDEEIRGLGFRPQVQLVSHLSLVFAVGSATRRRVAIAEAGAVAVRGGDVELGPNVLLRPIVERALLPSASYVAGPGEISYFAQVTAVAAALGRPVPPVLPRWAGLIVEPHVERILARLGLAVDELRDPHAAEQRLAGEYLPSSVRQALDAGRSAVRRELEALGARIRGEDAPLLPDAVLAGVARDVDRRMDRLERRVLAGAKRRHADVMRDVATARAALFPLGQPQERVLNAVPLLARHGPALFDLILGAARHHAAALSGLAGDNTLRPERAADEPRPSRPTESAID